MFLRQIQERVHHHAVFLVPKIQNLPIGIGEELPEAAGRGGLPLRRLVDRGVKTLVPLEDTDLQPDGQDDEGLVSPQDLAFWGAPAKDSVVVGAVEVVCCLADDVVPLVGPVSALLFQAQVHIGEEHDVTFPLLVVPDSLLYR